MIPPYRIVRKYCKRGADVLQVMLCARRSVLATPVNLFLLLPLLEEYRHVVTYAC